MRSASVTLLRLRAGAAALGCAVGLCLPAWAAGGEEVEAAALLPTEGVARPSDAAPQRRVELQACPPTLRMPAALCGRLDRPLDPAQPRGAHIAVHFAVWPAIGRQRLADPVFLVAGGPGQSAIEVAPALRRFFARLNFRRDIVFVDLRGTGLSAPLRCEGEALAAGLGLVEPERIARELADCRTRLQALPHGDLRQYTTTLAMQDLDAVREALGAEHINLVGSSYGSRAVLEYLRLYPQRVRRLVVDGVAPADMGLPASYAVDSQSALESIFNACGAEAACDALYPQLRSEWQHLLSVLPREVEIAETAPARAGRASPQSMRVTREMVLSATQAPLQTPALAPMLAEAIHQAALGHFEGMAMLGGWSSAARAQRAEQAAPLAMGLHFSVVCAEDMSRLGGPAEATGSDFGQTLADLYRHVCADWPRAEPPEAFYSLPKSEVAALLLSGGLDPVTPPRHGERVAAALGPKARHVEIPNAGHGVLGLPCLSEVTTAFIHAPFDELALRVDLSCAYLPRPFSYRRLGPQAGPRP
jgi:pimeloyl-ACP methyl ester carboxylesterase